METSEKEQKKTEGKRKSPITDSSKKTNKKANWKKL
jgi:hypothetical protein